MNVHINKIIACCLSKLHPDLGLKTPSFSRLQRRDRDIQTQKKQSVRDGEFFSPQHETFWSVWEPNSQKESRLHSIVGVQKPSQATEGRDTQPALSVSITQDTREAAIMQPHRPDNVHPGPLMSNWRAQCYGVLNE